MGMGIMAICMGMEIGVMREDIGMKSRGMGVSGDEFEWFWVVCRERKCGGKRKWVS